MGDTGSALLHAQAAVDLADVFGVRVAPVRWCWPPAARAAGDLGRQDVVRDMIAMLDAHTVGHVPPDLRAERSLTSARLAAAGGDPDAGEASARAIASLRELPGPYGLAGALLDHAGLLAAAGDAHGAAAAIVEARGIAERLACRPLLERAARTSEKLPAPA